MVPPELELEVSPELVPVVPELVAVAVPVVPLLV
jgi:hypothetical protein